MEGGLSKSGWWRGKWLAGAFLVVYNPSAFSSHFFFFFWWKDFFSPERTSEVDLPYLAQNSHAHTLSTLQSCRRISKSRRAHRALRKGPTLRRRLARSLRCRTVAMCMTGTSASRLVSVLLLVSSLEVFSAVLLVFSLSTSPSLQAWDSESKFAKNHQLH